MQPNAVKILLLAHVPVVLDTQTRPGAGRFGEMTCAWGGSWPGEHIHPLRLKQLYQADQREAD
jgi:hypothetical protein